MKQFDSITYNEKINEDKLTVVKFYGTWCGPCRVLSPILNEVSSKYPEVNMGDVDIDIHSDLAVKDGVRGVPTVIFYKNGKILDRMVGVQPAQNFISKIESLK